jgi:hypothetical protein
MSCRLCLLLGSTTLLLSGVAPAFSAEHQLTARLNRQQVEYRVVPRANPQRHFVWVRRWVWDDFWGDYHLQWVPRYTASSYTPRTHIHRTHLAATSKAKGEKVRAPKAADANTPDKAPRDGNTASAATRSPSAQGTAKVANDTAIASVAPKARPQPVANTEKDIKTASVDTHTSPTETTNQPAHSDLTKPLTPAEIRAAIPLGKLADPKQTLASAPIKSVWGDTLGKVRDVDMNGSNIKTVDAVVGGKGAVKIDASHLKYVKSRNLLVTTFSKEDAAKLPKADRS